MTMSILYERETANLGQIKKIITLVDGVTTGSYRRQRLPASTVTYSNPSTDTSNNGTPT